jgi:hypothetical protein
MNCLRRSRSQHGAQRCAQPLHHTLKLWKIQRLRPIRERAFRAGMHLDDNSVRANRNGSARYRLRSGSACRCHATDRPPPADARVLWQARRRPGRTCCACRFRKVLIPRSHSTTWSFPPESRYSAASSHSFTVADGPRLRRIGFLTSCESPQQGEVLHVARAHLQHIGVLTNQVQIFRTHHLGYHRKTSKFPSFAQESSALRPPILGTRTGEVRGL